MTDTNPGLNGWAPPVPRNRLFQHIPFCPLSQIAAERLRVFYPDGRPAYFCTYAQAMQMIRAGVARVLGATTRHIRTLELYEGPARPRAGTYYSHNHETDDNPPQVWTFKELRMPERAKVGA